MLDQLLLSILSVVGVSYFLLHLIYKWNIHQLYEMYRPDWLPEEFCVFCFSFWVGITLMIPAIICGINPLIFGIAIMISTTITPKLNRWE